jgi:hypothetical protein
VWLLRLLLALSEHGEGRSVLLATSSRADRLIALVRRTLSEQSPTLPDADGQPVPAQHLSGFAQTFFYFYKTLFM